MIKLIVGSRALHSLISKTSFDIDESDFSLLSSSNLPFRHSLDAEIDQEEEESKSLKD